MAVPPGAPAEQARKPEPIPAGSVGAEDPERLGVCDGLAGLDQ